MTSTRNGRALGGVEAQTNENVGHVLVAARKGFEELEMEAARRTLHIILDMDTLIVIDS